MCYGYLVLALIVFCDITLANKYCAKIDFSRPIYPEFRECLGQNFLSFRSQSYAKSKDLPKFRQNSRFFLSNVYFNYSCIETYNDFRIDPNTGIKFN